jgi:hypothetical protein
MQRAKIAQLRTVFFWEPIGQRDHATRFADAPRARSQHTWPSRALARYRRPAAASNYRRQTSGVRALEAGAPKPRSTALARNSLRGRHRHSDALDLLRRRDLPAASLPPTQAPYHLEPVPARVALQGSGGDPDRSAKTITVPGSTTSRPTSNGRGRRGSCKPSPRSTSTSCRRSIHRTATAATDIGGRPTTPPDNHDQFAELDRHDPAEGVSVARRLRRAGVDVLILVNDSETPGPSSDTLSANGRCSDRMRCAHSAERRAREVILSTLGYPGIGFRDQIPAEADRQELVKIEARDGNMMPRTRCPLAGNWRS